MVAIALRPEIAPNANQETARSATLPQAQAANAAPTGSRRETAARNATTVPPARWAIFFSTLLRTLAAPAV